MNNTTGAAELPEALRPEMLDDLIATFEGAGRGNYNLMRVELPRHQWTQLAAALRSHVEALSAAQAGVPADAAEPTCTACGATLHEVTQSPNSYLSAEQFDADKLGDWYCKCCPQGPSDGSRTHRYFWNSDLVAPALAAPQPSPSPAPAQPGQEGEREYPPLPEPAATGLGDEYESFDRNGKAMGKAYETILYFKPDQMRAYVDADRAARAAPQPATADAVDAARYRWLRRWKGQEHEPPFTVQHEIDGTLWGGDLDAAIDAAMDKGENHD